MIGKQPNEEVKYVKSESKNVKKIKVKDFIKIPYKILNDFNGWLLVNEGTRKIIDKIVNSGTPLGKKFEIRNGFATLNNDVYVFTPVSESDEYYVLKQGKKEYKIEKRICRNAIKPNVLKSENEITENTEKIIFPYESVVVETDLFDGNNIAVKVFEENFFKENYPFAYKYLLSNKKVLAERDKGQKAYDKWYAFGRTQALNYYGNKLFFPYISDKPCFVYTEDKEFLFYNGFAIFSNSSKNLLVLKKILYSSIFWFYIKNTSKPYDGDYYSLGKNYIKRFGICNLTEKEEEKLLMLRK